MRVRLSRAAKAAALVVVMLLLGLAGLSFAKRPNPGPTTDDLLRSERQIPFDREAADPPPE